MCQFSVLSHLCRSKNLNKLIGGSKTDLIIEHVLYNNFMSSLENTSRIS